MEKIEFNNVYKLVMELAKRGVSVDYSIIDQEVKGIKCYSSLKIYTINVCEKDSYGTVIKSASFDSLIYGMSWGIMIALDYLEKKDSNITLNDLNETPLCQVADLAKKGIAIDYTITHDKNQELAYAITITKTQSFGETITKDIFYDLDEGMKYGITIAEVYLASRVCK